MKVAVPLAKYILAPLRITAAVSGVQKKDTRFRDNNVNKLNQRNEWHNENSSSSLRL